MYIYIYIYCKRILYIIMCITMSNTHTHYIYMCIRLFSLYIGFYKHPRSKKLPSGPLPASQPAIGP